MKYFKYSISIFLVFTLAACVGSKDSSSESAISLSSLLSTGSGGVSASGPPPYGNQSLGSTPTNAGVPHSVMQAPDLFNGYQTNLNTLDLLGRFYHRNPNFPEVRHITDVSTVKLNKNLEKSDQLDWDFNQFILDSKMGLILFTVGLQKLDYAQNGEFIGASQISVQKNGRIGILGANQRLNLCFSFNGNAIIRDPNCSITAFTGLKLAPLGTDHFILLSQNDVFSSVHAVTGIQKMLDFRKILRSSISVSTGENVIMVIHEAGSSISTFVDTGVDSATRFEQRAATDLIQVAKEGDLGNLTAPLKVNSIVRSYEGRFYAYTPTLNAMISFDPALSVHSKIWEFPYLPIPFFRMKNVMGIDMHPNSRLIHVFNSMAIHTLSETNVLEREDLVRYLPDKLVPVLTSILDGVMEANFDPRKDIFQYPVVKQALQSALNQL